MGCFGDLRLSIKEDAFLSLPLPRLKHRHQRILTEYLLDIAWFAKVTGLPFIALSIQSFSQAACCQEFRGKSAPRRSRTRCGSPHAVSWLVIQGDAHDRSWRFSSWPGIKKGSGMTERCVRFSAAMMLLHLLHSVLARLLSFTFRTLRGVHLQHHCLLRWCLSRKSLRVWNFAWKRQ